MYILTCCKIIWVAHILQCNVSMLNGAMDSIKIAGWSESHTSKVIQDTKSSIIKLSNSWMITRHERGMCMPMTLLTIRKMSSMMFTIWIVTLWTIKPMCTSRIPRILHLIGMEHWQNHILLHLIGTEHSQNCICLASNGTAFSQMLKQHCLRWGQGYHFGSLQETLESQC